MYTPGTMLLDDSYRIEAEIGRGAFGVVYRATHVKLNVLRAVKVLRSDEAGVGSTLYADYRNRFQVEARLAARLNHPHVIQVYDFQERDGVLHSIMELAPGGNVADLLARDKPLPVAQVVAIVREAAAGLAALHEQLDAVHRDVKPANLLLDGHGRVKVADLGLAQVGGLGMSQRSGQGSMAPPHPGTPNYAAPEHRDGGEPLAPTADVYALGCVVFELLTGQLWKSARRKVTAVRDLRPDVPAALDAAVMRMLAEAPGFTVADRANPAKRFVDMEGVLAALQEGEMSQPSPGVVTAPPPVAQSVAPAPIAPTPVTVQHAKAAQVNQPVWQRIGIEMVRIPAGAFLYGDDKQRITLDEYWIAKTLVTNGQYKAFFDATGHPQVPHWVAGQIPEGRAQHPVTFIDWNDATAFCRWVGLSLPTEQQWEKAARGSDGRIYPWGNGEPDRNRRNLNNSDTTPVGAYPAGASPFGLLDMVGNVREWCQDRWDNDPHQWRVIRGGSYWSVAHHARCASRDRNVPDYRDFLLGFRVVSPAI